MTRRAICPVLCVLTSAMLVGCQSSRQPEAQVEVSNAGYQLDQLFTDARGYTVFRFYDAGEYRYYVVGPDGSAQMLPTTKTVREPDPHHDGVGYDSGLHLRGDVHRPPRRR